MVSEQTVTAPNRFWVVRKPDASGTVVAKFDTAGETEVVIPDSCVAYSVPDRTSLENQTADESVLTAEEKQILGVLP